MKKHQLMEAKRISKRKKDFINEHMQDVDKYNTMGDDIFAEIDGILASPLDHFRKNLKGDKQPTHDHMKDVFGTEEE